MGDSVYYYWHGKWAIAYIINSYSFFYISGAKRTNEIVMSSSGYLLTPSQMAHMWAIRVLFKVSTLHYLLAVFDWICFNNCLH